MSGKAKKVPISQGERDSADLAEEQYADYKSRFVPMENHYQEQLDRIPDDRPLATGQASADVAQAYDPAIRSIRDTQFSHNVNPNSGRAVLSLADATVNRADAGGKAMVSADQTTDDRYWAGQNQLIALGQGQSNTANVGFRANAGLDAAEATSRAQADAMRESGKWDALGTVAGVGTRLALADAGGPSSGAGVAGRSKPWWDVTSGPRKLS